MKRSWMLGGITATISVVVTLAVLEIVLHVVDIPRERVSHQRLFVEYDAVRGWRNIPNSHGRLSTDEYAQDLLYNARGLRGPDLPFEKPPGTLRVLLVGDSFVDGYTEAIGNRVSDVLEELLRTDTADNVQVIAMGAGGYSTDQELLWLESEGLQYQPDVVVLMFYANDIWYNTLDRYWRGGKPRFSIQGDSLTLANVPVPRFDSTRNESSSGGLNGWVRANSKLYWLLARAVQNQRRLYGLAVRMGLTEPSPEMVFDAGSGEVIPGEFSVFRRDPPAQVETAWRVTEALVVRMRNATEAAGARFIAFLIPIRSQIYTQSEDVRQNVGADSSAIDADAVTRRFLAICRAHSMDCVDPTAEFIAKAESLRVRGERLYYRYDWHWNANGHLLAARILADQLQSRMRPE